MRRVVHASRDRTACRAGFTVLELLTVIAVIAILATILIPVVGGVQKNAKKAKTRVQFSQWGAAIEAFRQEYGYYPNFTTFTSGEINTGAKAQQFIETLSGRTISGGALTGTDPGLVAGNTKRIRFYSFATDDLNGATPPLLKDAFGNEAIVVLMDKNYNGLVKGDTTDGYAGGYPPVGSSWTPGNIPTDGVRAGVIFYSAGAGTSADDIVTSW